MTIYYNEIDEYAANWLRNLIKAGHIAPGEVDTRSIEHVAADDLVGYKQCHFFAGIGGWSLAARMAGYSDDDQLWTGSCPCQPYSIANVTNGGQEDKTTNDTCYRNSSASSRSASLQESLGNKFQMRLVRAGLTKPLGVWKRLDTPAGRSYFQLFLSARDMKESGFIGWPTPAARDGKDISRSNAFLSARSRHFPSMATRWLTLGLPWTAISAVYCLAMGYPSCWNEVRLKDTETP